VNAGFVSLTKPLTALQAVLERGGFTSGADLEQVIVVSRGNGDSVSRRLNLRDEVEGLPGETSMLAPDDVVFVPRTGIANANAWVNSWIDGLTPQILKGLRFPTF
jgi:polysaccharide export outer membrane protein